MSLNCLMLSMALLWGPSPAPNHTEYHLTLSSAGNEQDVEAFIAALKSELDPEIEVQTITRYKDQQIRKFILHLKNNKDFDITFRLLGFQTFEFSFKVDEEKGLDRVAYRFDKKERKSVDLKKETRVKITYMHREEEQ